MGKIRLLVDAHVFDDTFQGSRTFLKGIYSAIIAQNLNIELFLVASDIDNLKKNFQEKENVHFVKLNSKSKYKRLLFEFPRLIKQHKIDYAHFTYIVPPIKYCKYITSIHDILFEEFPNDFPWLYRVKNGILFKFSAIVSDIVHTISLYSRDSLQRNYKISPEKILALPIGIEAIYLNDYNKNIAKKIISDKYNIHKFILYVSRIEPRKNHEFLLDAYLKLKLWEKGFHLVFIGKNSITNESLETKIRNLDENIKPFIKRLEDVDIDFMNFLNAANLSVYPSKGEGFGIPPLESAALKIDTICANQTALAEFEFFGDNLFNPYDINELITKINNSLNEDNEIKSIRLLKTSNYIKDNYDWNGIAKSFIERIQSHSNRSEPAK